MSIRIKQNSEEVVDLVFEAILKNRLKPGVKLSEISFQEEFGYSRSVVRQGFDKLVDSGLLIYKKNQGVSVAYPTEDETKKIYEARMAIEGSVINILVEKHQQNELDFSVIDSLILKEKGHHEAKEFDELIGISCHFHMSLAELCGNKFIVNSLKPLIPLSTLAATVYSDPNSSFCSFAEHYELIDAVKSNDLKKASKSMNRHLEHCVESLDFSNKVIKNNSHSHIFN